MSPLVLTFLFFLIATLYASVGSGGGSGYLAMMAIFGLEPAIMRATALALNILVTSISTWKFYRAGHFSGRLFWPIAGISIPAAFLGGRLTLPGNFYQVLVSVVLFYAAYRLLLSTRKSVVNKPNNGVIRHLQLPTALLIGAAIGLLSGLIGIGGGIFLSPLLLLGGWASTRQTMAASAAFTLANSVAGLLGRLSEMPALPASLPLWLAVVAIGGWLGAEYGSHKLNPILLRRILALLLVFGGFRLIT